MYHKKKSKSSFKHVKGKINFFRFTDININYSYEILINLSLIHISEPTRP